MFCQSCGASNADEARFCNMCGSRIAQAGEPGGQLPSEDAVAPAPVERTSAAIPAEAASPAPAAFPPQASPTLQGAPNPYGTTGAGGGPSLMDVSLASIGVRSNKKGFAVVAAVALVLVAVGAGASYLLTRSGGEQVAVGSAEPTDPFVIGTPLPEGANEPDVDFVSGGNRPGVDAPVDPSEPSGRRPEPGSGASEPSHRHPDMRPTTMPASPGTTMHASTTGMGTAGGPTTSMGTAGGPTTTGMGPRGGTTTPGGTTTAMGPRGGTTTPGGTTPGGTTTGGATTTGSGSSGNMGSGSNTVPDLPTDAPEERDIEMDMYGARVRFVVRRYYAARARGCFDRATRNNPGVSGTVIINMTISASGQVGSTSVARNTTGDATLGACLASQVRQWRLPPPPGGSLEMQMPFSR